jgi:pyruvate dehydrogenase E2 component (dihydrolipoamide acetyltransferase)
VLRGADQETTAALESGWDDLLARTKASRLVPAEYSGATFYLSNLGVFPIVSHFDAVVPLGASAILALASMAPDGSAECTLSCDHRVVFGADAAHFLTHLATLLASSETWL